MDQITQTTRWSLDGFGFKWVSLPLLLFLLAFSLSWWNDAVPLSPAHRSPALPCAFAAVLFAFGWTWIAMTRSAPMPSDRRAMNAAGFALLCFGGLMTFSLALTHVVQGMIDFPLATTRTQVALLPIDFASHHNTRGNHWNLEISGQRFSMSEDDYRAMLAHRRPDDVGGSPDRIASNGYFCAQVLVQKSGAGLRVLHAFWRPLSVGTVTFCPSESTKS